MRICDDEMLVREARGVEPRTPAAYVFLGKLLTRSPFALIANSPLHCLVTGSELDEHWRSKVAPSEQSLWSTLEFYVALYAQEDMDADPIESYARLRDLSLADFSA